MLRRFKIVIAFSNLSSLDISFEYIFAFEDYGGLPNEVKIFSYNEENEAVVERWNNTETSLTYLYCKTVGEVSASRSCVVSTYFVLTFSLPLSLIRS